MKRAFLSALAVGGAAVLLAGCSGSMAENDAAVVPRAPAPSTTTAAPSVSTAPSSTPPTLPPPTPTPTPTTKPFKVATLSVPSAGIKNLRVERYKGTPDDYVGTQMQNRGIAVAPYGSWGGVSAGQVGNLILTAHRTSHGSPMAGVPDMKNGDLIKITADGKTYTYKMEKRLWVDFRDTESRNSQRLPVPGKPGVDPTRPAIVLSTCATLEDDNRGISYRDSNGNPAHRIAVVGYLVE